MGCNIDGGSGNRLPKRVRSASLDDDDFAKQANTMESDSNPARAINVVRRVAMLCDFIEHPGIKSVYDGGQPVSMPPLPGTLGFDVPLWVGLGMVGLWAALDGFAERAALPVPGCPICGSRSCISARFADHVQGSEGRSIAELEDLRHLYAHNYAGEADDVYFERKRHILAPGTAVPLTCGAQFDGRQARLDLSHLRMYSITVQSMLERFQ